MIDKKFSLGVDNCSKQQNNLNKIGIELNIKKAAELKTKIS